MKATATTVNSSIDTGKLMVLNVSTVPSTANPSNVCLQNFYFQALQMAPAVL
jgi:hypothetical protein